MLSSIHISSGSNSIFRNIFLLLLAMILIAAYLPVLQANYVFHDDLYFFGPWPRKFSCSGYDQIWVYTHNYGRPFGGYIKCFYGLSFESIPQAKFVRMFNLGLLFVLAVMGWRWLIMTGISEAKSWIIIVPLTLLTCMQTPIAQITNAHHLTAAILTLLAVNHAWKASVDPKVHRTRMAFACLLGISSMLTYQPAAMLYWAALVPLVIMQVSVIDRKTIERFFWAGVPGAVIMITPIVYAKFAGMRRMVFTNDFAQKFYWLWHDEVPLFLSGWQVFPSTTITCLQLLLIVALLAAGFIRAQQKSLWFVKTVIVTGLLVVTFLPNFLAAESMVIHRTLIATKTLIAGLEIAGLIMAFEVLAAKLPQLLRLRNAAVAGLLLWGVAAVHHNMEYFYTVPLELEYNFVKRSLYNIEGEALSTPVHLVRPSGPYLAEGRMSDEFGSPNTIFTSDPMNIVYAALKEMNYPIKAEDIFFGTFLSVGNDRNTIDQPDGIKSTPVDPKRRVIDMNDIAGLLRKPETR